MKKVLVFILISIPIFFWGIWFIFPEEVIKNEIINSLSTSDLKAELTGFRKGLLYNFKIDKLLFKNSSNEILVFKNIDSKIKFINLFLFQIDMSIKCDFAGGVLDGRLLIKKNGISGKLFLDNGNIEEINTLYTAGLKAKGSIRATVDVNTNNIIINFIAKDVDMEPFIIKDTYIPLNLFKKINGSFIKEKDSILIESLSFEGEDIIARVKGKIIDSKIDCNMELMPRREYLDKQLIIYGLDKYKVAPGYYVIPVSQIFGIKKENNF